MAFPRRRRRRWDSQPTDVAGVLLASDGRSNFSTRAVAQAAALAAESGSAVAVVTIAKVHGFSLGLPHPGLMPTKAEVQERTKWVESAISTLRHQSIAADGQVATTRHGMKSIVGIALRRGVKVIVIDGTSASGVRRVIEGDPGTQLRRKLRKHSVEVRIVPPQ